MHRGGPGHRVDLGKKLSIDDAELKVLDNFMEGGRLKSIPARHSKRMIVLRFLAEQFKPGERYAESDVNWILGRFHPDFAALRRYLVDEELMQRRESIYWRTGSLPAEWP